MIRYSALFYQNLQHCSPNFLTWNANIHRIDQLIDVDHHALMCSNYLYLSQMSFLNVRNHLCQNLSLSLYLKLEINFRALRFPKEFSMETAEMVLAALTEIMLIAILLLCFLKLYVVHDLVKAKKFQMPGKPRRLFVKNTY